jgi:hypothetical protein
MPSTIWGIVHGGKVEPLGQTDLPEGARVLITLMHDDDALFWRTLSEQSLRKVWDNDEDDVYAALLTK